MRHIEAEPGAVEASTTVDGDEALADLFRHDVVLPAPFFLGERRDHYVFGEQALMLAVLEDGIVCFRKDPTGPGLQQRRLAREADEWVRAVDYDWPFSFVNVCESVGVDPIALRGALLAWKARREARVTRAADRRGRAAANVQRLRCRLGLTRRC